MRKRVHVFVSGKVHGVFFRANTKEKALSLGLKGWVRNTHDGIEAVIEGKEKEVGELLDWMKKGPPLAEVEKVNIEEQDYKGEFDDFKIHGY